jgi:hypothetical protein
MTIKVVILGHKVVNSCHYWHSNVNAQANIYSSAGGGFACKLRHCLRTMDWAKHTQ